MNHATRSVLDEMENELVQQLDDTDEKVDTWTHQAKELLSTVFRIINCYLSGFFLSILMLVALSLVFLPSETVDFLYNVQRDEALETIRLYTNTSQILAFGWMIFNIVTSRIRFVSIKQLKQNAIHERVRRTKEIIEVTEEVMFRHGLIKIEDKQ